ncbi:recombinase family protein [Faecalibacterium duncaniae]
MTAVIYARYSSDSQREESIEGQIRECTAYAKKNGITIVKHYIDRAISAKTDNRPQFQQMIKDSDKKLFDIVLVWKLDRFARNRYDSARYKTQLKKNGVKLVSATEIISEGPEGIILESVLEGYVEYYSADLAEKVVRGQTENILKGRCNGGRGTFGYTLDSERKFHIDPLASPFVLESFRKYRNGLTMKEIRDWLNENGIKNPVGGAFTYNSVEHMLKNRRYIGELKFRDVVVPDAIPPIVPLELFDDVQEKIAKNKKAPARRKAEDDYLLTTKLHCGYCGALMFGESGTSRTGEVHRYYKCATAKKKKGCKKKTVRKQWLEDLVVNQTMQLVRNDAAMESIIAKVMELQNKENTNIPLYEKQLRDAESGIQNMLNAIQAGILTSSTKERLEQLEETKRELEARIAEEKLAKPKVTEEFIRFWLLRFRKLDMSLKDQRQALVDTFINSIYLYDDKVLITFNYKEGTQTITFEEAAQAASKGNGSDLDCFPAPENAVKSKGFMAFLFCKPRVHGFCTVFARWVLSIFIRSNESLSIIHKVLRRSEHFLTERVQPIDAFGFPSAARGEKEPFDGCISLIHSQGTGYIKRSDVKKNAELIDKYKATISILVPCNGEVGIDPSKGYKAITTPRIEIPGEVNTFSYLVLGAFDTEEEIKNYKQYLMCKFTRFMLRLTYSSMHIARANFVFVPDQDFMETWTDEKLYKKYELTEEEIAFIESTIRVME